MQGLIAKKVGMTRVLDEQGQMIPVTLLKVEDQQITKILTVDRDGYHGIQVGYYQKPERKLNKPDLTRLRKGGIEANFTRFKEYRFDSAVELELGSKLSADLLAEVKAVDVTGVTKGHGFEGSITRWGHKTGRRTHGSHFHRRPGSLGQRTTPGRVYKNKEMPGHMGSAQRTIQNLKVVDVDVEANVIALKGSVPGHRDGFVIVKPSTKLKESK
ncbi:50S ribosomal protein L3 [Pseudobacteriovorax antillogorgiicola]|uniref:Large ribosomal subunit protein uL3 n=1 Tax=Pseudobacteriovorax antillogorgiicola TaxID=1513793 RepID=A0A1Y6B9Q5_9BACT|nr:50S ribosomal protein L3 [Pseudobacteriovorax antillogorgiicola]TCS59362.1 LSU ribosomal protein L3P [Pseudobacteriovorax antillogorgiicola]SME88987.1 LSU ribosomal protein L3P [Pseudobacteriovorax antillogorgiicola]